MNLSTSRETCALDDAEALDALLAPIPGAFVVRAHLTSAPRGAKQTARYDPSRATLHHVATDGKRVVRLSIAGIPQQRVAGAILTVAEVLSLSAKACGLKLEKLLVLPVVARTPADAPPPHPEVRAGGRIVPAARVPVH
jgi:hypothetical protein